MVNFLSNQIPLIKTKSGITIIRREKWRTYLETDELADKLRRFHVPISVVQMEKESFAAQVNIMRNTLILIAPHGAGTMNQIFMPKGGKIIELFPKGIANWHAKAVAKVFGHDLAEIESNKPGSYGREPSEEIKKWIEMNGWPDRQKAGLLRKQSQSDIVRIIRDVKSFSIHTEQILKIVERALSRFGHC
jgi:hypothetical protein